jgi:hypothetical protein
VTVTLATGSGTTALPVTSQASGMTAADFLKKVGLNGLKTYNLSGIKNISSVADPNQNPVPSNPYIFGQNCKKKTLILLIFNFASF